MTDQTNSVNFKTKFLNNPSQSFKDVGSGKILEDPLKSSLFGYNDAFSIVFRTALVHRISLKERITLFT